MKKEVIEKVLFPVNAARLMKVSLIHSYRGNERCWAGNNDGVFRVKDAYKLALNTKNATFSNGINPIGLELSVQEFSI